ncbi:glycosyltransferase family protein [Bacteroidota bacterium]
MKFLFIVQGEGRGHLTQAIALSKILRKNQHEIVQVLVGKNRQRNIPSYFFNSFPSKVQTYIAPNFLRNKKKQGLLIFITLVYNLIRIPVYLKSIRFIHNILKEYNPDVLVNFYELMAGLTYLLYKPKVRHVTLGHHYFFDHPHFQFPHNRKFERKLLWILSSLTAYGANKKLCLSFTHDFSIPEKRILVVPPLLKPEIQESEIKNDDFILVYLLNPGYSNSIINWSKQNPGVKIHVYWDKKKSAVEEPFSDDLIFHKIDYEKFNKHLCSCSKFATTAGFESICEAFYLGKPILAVPVKNHFEQECNAIDAQKNEIALKSDKFDLGLLSKFEKDEKKEKIDEFRKWINEAERMYLELLTG